jgi:hypothetical protein
LALVLFFFIARLSIHDLRTKVVHKDIAQNTASAAPFPIGNALE